MTEMLPTTSAIQGLLATHIAEYPDFPTPGVLFRDITPLLANGEAFKELITLMAEHYRGKIDAVAGLEQGPRLVLP